MLKNRHRVYVFQHLGVTFAPSDCNFPCWVTRGLTWYSTRRVGGSRDHGWTGIELSDGGRCWSWGAGEKWLGAEHLATSKRHRDNPLGTTRARSLARDAGRESCRAAARRDSAWRGAGTRVSYTLNPLTLYIFSKESSLNNDLPRNTARSMIPRIRVLRRNDSTRGNKILYVV